MDAVFALEVAIGVVALDEDGGGLDARLVTGLVVHQLIGVAVALGPAGIHTVEHLGPVLGLGAACSGMEGENGVVGVVFAGQQSRQTALADLLFQVVVPGGDLRQQGGVVLLLGHFAQGHGVLPLGHQPVILLDAVLQALDLLGHLLAVLDVVPEAVLLRLGLQVLQLLAVLGDTQGLLQLAQSGLQGLELLFILVVFNDCHSRSSPYRKKFLSLSIIAGYGCSVKENIPVSGNFSSQDEAAVAGEHLAGDEGGPVPGQEGHGVGDVLRRAQAAQGRFLSQLRQYLRRQGIQHIRADDPGGHAVDPDVGRAQLHGTGSGR